jgi:copper chaperone
METFQFKTNINCSGCVAKISPALNETAGIESWTVDTLNPGKILTIETNSLTADKIEALVSSAGFNIKKMS